MNTQYLTDELNRLTTEVARLERRIAEGEGGIVDHILLQATLVTHASMQKVLASSGVGWAMPVGRVSAVHHRVDPSRPRNVAQLFSSSTHRVSGMHAVSGRITGVF